MPPTTGGRTSGNSISERRMRCPRKELRASTMAIGTPNSRHKAVEAIEVCRLSRSAATEDSEVIRAKNRDQSTRVVMAAKGKMTNSAPSPAGR